MTVPAYISLFIGIILVGLGSAFYHYNPNNDSLVFDRLPMNIVFMAFLSASVSARINERIGRILLLPLLLIGIFSVFWRHHTEQMGHGDLRLYILVQFYPIVAILLIFILFKSQGGKAKNRLFIWVILWYAIAKILERFDAGIYHATGLISGHSLKHLAAAAATLYIVKIAFNSSRSSQRSPAERRLPGNDLPARACR